MVCFWLGLGAFVGILSAPPNGGPIGFVAGAVAGMIVLPWFGAPLGLLGGRWQESLLGSGCGLLSGILVAYFNGSPQRASTASLFLLFGAIVGAALPPLCRFYLRLALHISVQMRPRRTDRPVNSS